MFIHAHETLKTKVLFEGQAVCKTCKSKSDISVYSESRKTNVALMSYDSISYHMRCAHCGAIYDISKLVNATSDTYDLDMLLERCGRKEFPAFARIMLFLWFMSVMLPIFGLIIAWKIHPYRKYFSKGLFKVMMILSVVSNACWIPMIVMAIINKDKS